MFNALDYYDEYGNNGLHPSDLGALKYAWAQLLDFAYSPYKPDHDEIHSYMQQIGKIIGEMPPEVMPFSGTAELR